MFAQLLDVRSNRPEPCLSPPIKPRGCSDPGRFASVLSETVTFTRTATGPRSRSPRSGASDESITETQQRASRPPTPQEGQSP